MPATKSGAMSFRWTESSEVKPAGIELPETAVPLRNTPWFGPPPSALSTASRKSSVADAAALASVKPIAYKAVPPSLAPVAAVEVQRARGSLGSVAIQAPYSQ